MANLTLIVSDAPETLETKVNQSIQAGNYLFGGLMVMPYDSLNRERFYQWVIDHQINAARSHMTLIRADAVTTIATRIENALDNGKYLYGRTVIVPATSNIRERFFQWVSDENINVKPSGPVSVDNITGIGSAGKDIITADDISAVVAMLGVTSGVDGREVELTANYDAINWRYTDETEWRELVLLSAIEGKPGPGVALTIADGYIQWKNEDDENWIRLISLEDLHGLDADQIELQVSGGYIQWRYESDDEWVNLIPLSDLSGSDGQSVELQVSGGYIQWRVTGSSTWNNLISVTTLTGPANNLSIGTVTSGSPASATITGTPPEQVLNLVLPSGAAGISYNPQSPAVRTVTIGTAYQHTDKTKPYRVIANVRATQSLTVAGLSADKLELRVGPTAASVVAGGSGGFSLGVWESGITGIALMIGAGIQDGGSMVVDVPAGWYFQINRLAGSSATVVSCFTQSMTA